MQPWPALAAYARKVQLRSGLTLFAFEAGPNVAPPLLLIHGLGDEADTWRHVFLPLAERYRVVALDLPGFGRSDKPRRTYSLAFLCSAVVELMDALDHQTVGLVGHSLGAVIAQTVALEHPARVRELQGERNAGNAAPNYNDIALQSCAVGHDASVKYHRRPRRL